MKTRVLLLIRKVWFADYSWKELEEYLGVAKENLIAEFKKFFKDIPGAAEEVEKTIQRANENSRKKQRQRIMGQVR